MVFNAVFIVLSIIMFISGIYALNFKNSKNNIGYIINCSILFYLNIVCVILQMTNKMTTAKILLLSYHVLIPWFFFFLSKMVFDTTGLKTKTKIPRIIFILIAAMPSVLAGLNLFGFHFISVSKRILFGNLWWVTTPTVKSISFLSIYTYFTLTFVYSLFTLVLCVIAFLKTPSLYKTKNFFFMGTSILYSIIILTFFYYNIPISIDILITDITFIFLFYFVFVYSDNKFISHSINSFANEMSDGIVVYNVNKELIHVNSLLIKKNLKNGYLIQKSSKISRFFPILQTGSTILPS